eukprot:m.104357 g.104357  ORF g.104357 m.104357 type:complete len:129 (-) comp13840_c0_seq12:2338-2724(-)
MSDMAENPEQADDGISSLKTSEKLSQDAPQTGTWGEHGREDDEAPDGIQTPPLLRRKLKEILALPQEDLSTLDVDSVLTKLKNIEKLEHALSLEEEKQRKAGLLLGIYSDGRFPVEDKKHGHVSLFRV